MKLGAASISQDGRAGPQGRALSCASETKTRACANAQVAALQPRQEPCTQTGAPSGGS